MTNLIGIWPNVFRVLEIAKTGNFSVSIYFDKDYKNGFEDYASLKEFCKGWFDNFVVDGDLYLGINTPVYRNNSRQSEKITDIENRIQKSLLSDIPDNTINGASESILKMAIEKLNISLLRTEKLKEIALVIARMDLSKLIRAEHVAEAIHYSHIFSDDYCNAEGKAKVFGDMITVKIGNIYSDDIKKAIEYLTSLL